MGYSEYICAGSYLVFCQTYCILVRITLQNEDDFWRRKTACLGTGVIPFRGATAARGRKACPTSRTKLWNHLNSPFGIWILATVLVGIVSWGYAKWEATRSERDTFRSAIVKLDAKIEAILQYA